MNLRHNRARHLLLVTSVAAVALLTSCSAEEDAATTTSSSSSTPSSTSSAPEPTAAVPPPGGDGADRAQPTVPAGADEAVLSPEVCAQMYSALEALTIPVTVDGERATELDDTLETIEVARDGHDGYSSEVLTGLVEAMEAARDQVIDEGVTGWQEVLIEHREGPDEDDVELQIELLRGYVNPRC